MNNKATRLMSVLLVLCLSFSLVLAGCTGNKEASDNTPAANGGSGAETPQTEAKGDVRDTLNYGLNQEPAKLDPQSDSLLVTSLVNKQIYDTLIRRDDVSGEMIPGVATEWEWADDLTLRMTLRDDVFFHNGEKLTADDVLFTLGRCVKGAASASVFSSFDAENSVVIDPTHIEIKMKQPYGAALNMLASMKAGIVCKSYCESVDETTFGREPVGSGAFKFDSWVSGDHITLVRNDNYWGDKAAYTTLNLRVLTDATARAIELETGGVDIIDTMNVSDLKRFSESDSIDVYTLDATKILYVIFNENNPILANEKVRMAIAHAVDMPAVVDMAFGNAASLAKSFISTTVFGYAEQGLYSYDVELAKQLLTEAGYPDGFTFKMTTASMSSNVRTAEAIQSFLREVGITMEIESFDAATWMSMCRDGSADTSVYGLTTDTYDPDQSFMNLYANSSFVSVRTSDETVNKLLNEGKMELDVEKRAAIYGELQKYMFEHVTWLPICQPIINYAAQPYVKGFVPNVGVQPDLKLVYFE